MKRALILAVMAALAASAFAADTQYRNPEALRRLVGDKAVPYILVDVRTPEEYGFSHIPSAVNIPVSDIAKAPPTPDKEALIIVYCRSGARSATAKRTLDGLGYTNVVDFGSMSRWIGELDREDSEE
jgi:phage shock protein E